jgi:hypothetical protein
MGIPIDENATDGVFYAVHAEVISRIVGVMS